MESFEDRILCAAQPDVSLQLTSPVGNQPLIGENVVVTATFDNTNATDTGYGPYVDFFFDKTGNDGAGAAVDDGLSFVSASFLGTPVTSTILTFAAADASHPTGPWVTHPYAVDSTGAPLTIYAPAAFGVGDQLAVLQLPFGSFTGPQPRAAIDVTLATSNLADANVALPIQARGGFQYGNDALNNPSTDPSIIDATNASLNITPELFRLTKTYLGPEDETATGPNFPQQYRIDVDIATGQTISNLQLTDLLPSSMQFVSVNSVTPAASSIATPSLTTPGGTLTRQISSVTGTASTQDASMVFTFFIPRIDSASGVIVNAASGDDVNVLNNASTSGSWVPVDSRDATTPVSINPVGPEHTLIAKSIATQKSLTIVNNAGPATYSPGDVVEYVIQVEVSDYFAFQNLVLSDILSDGQRLDPTFTPTLTTSEHGGGLAVAAFNSSNWNASQNFTGATASLPIYTIDPAANDGTTAIQFRLSNEMLTRGSDAQLVGGGLPNGGTGAGALPNNPPLPFGGTTATIRYRVIIQDKFSDTPGNPYISPRDLLTNLVPSVSGDLLTVTNLAPNGQSEADNSGTAFTTEAPTIVKSLYQINGVAPTSPLVIRPGDLVTYRIQFTIPHGDIDQFKLTDYLPLPVFNTNDFDITFSGAAADGVAPGVNQAKRGPNDTLIDFIRTQTGNPTFLPTVTEPGGNAVQFNYGNNDDPTNTTKTADVLFTVRVNGEFFADGLFLTNQAQAEDGGVRTSLASSGAIVQVILGEPNAALVKGVVGVNSTGFNLGGITYTAPGTASNFSGGPLDSTAEISALDASNAASLDAGDFVRFGIAVRNTGRSDAFDVNIADQTVAGFTIPASLAAMNFTARRGDGTLLSLGTDYTASITAGGAISFQLTDNYASAPGIGGLNRGTADNGSAVTDGTNTVLITYDLTVANAAQARSSITNTGSLTNYSNLEGGVNFQPTPQTNTATTTIASPTLAKVLTSTEINNATNGNTQAVIGELATYTLTLTVPEGVTASAVINDTLDAGLAFVDVVSVAYSGGVTSATTPGSGTAPANVTVGPNGSTLAFNFGNITNSNSSNGAAETITIVYRAVVLDQNTLPSSPGNQSGTLLNNSASLSAQFTDSPVGVATGYVVGQSVATADVTVIEPSITVSKGIGNTSSGPFTPTLTGVDGSNIVFYQVRLSVAAGATAFDTTLNDPLPAFMTSYSIVSVNGGGLGLGDFTISGGTLQQASVAGLDIAGGTTVDIVVQGTIDPSIASGQSFGNTATARWTSLDGVVTDRSIYNTASDERTGAGGIGTDAAVLDNYATAGTATLTIGNPTVDKRFQGGSLSADDTNVATAGVNALDRIVVGEGVIYDILVTLTEGTTRSLRVDDVLPVGLRYDTAFNGTGFQIITSAAASNGQLSADFSGSALAPALGVLGAGTLGADGVDARFTFGDTVATADNNSANNSFIIRVRAIAGDVATNQATTLLRNTGQIVFSDPDNGPGGTPLDVTIADATPLDHDVTIIEPTLNITKTATPTGDAGDTVTYTITLTNPSGVNQADAYDISLVDNLPAILTGKTITGVTSSGFGGAFTAPVAGDFQIVGDVLGLTAAANIDVPVGATFTITVTGTIPNTVIAGQTITNVATNQWTSTNGTTADERNGTDGLLGGGTLNDYRQNSSTVTTIIGTPTVDKRFQGGSLDAGDTNVPTAGSNALDRVVVGESVTYDILVTLPEGTTQALRIDDLIPSGMRLDTTFNGNAGFQIITSAAASGGLLAADFAAPAALSGATIAVVNGGTLGANDGDGRVSFGNVTNPGDNLANNNAFLVRVVGIVTDVIGNQSGTTLTNVGGVVYQNLLGADVTVADPTPNDHSVTVVEPTLTINKSVNVPSGDAGDIIDYTIVISNPNAGTPADAYDVTFSDAIPAAIVAPALLTGVGQFTTTGFGGAFVAPTSADFTFTGNTISYTGVSLDIPVGGSVTLTIRGTMANSVAPGQTITNTAMTAWTSTNGANADERNGSGIPSPTLGTPDPAILNNYSIASSAVVTAVGSPAFTKSIISTSEGSTSGANVTIGETVTYGIIVTLPEGTTPNLSVVDFVPAGMQYVSNSVVTTAAASSGLLSSDFGGSFVAPTVSGGAANGDDLTWTFGAITVNGDNVGGNNSFLLVITLRALDVAGNAGAPPAGAATVLPNSAQLDITGDSLLPQTSNTVNVTVVEPNIVVTKNITQVTADAGDTLNVTLTFQNTGGSNSFDTIVSDVLNPAIYDVASINFGTAGVEYPAGFTPAFVAGTGTLSYSGGTIAAGSTATFTFTIALRSDLQPGQVISNTTTITQATTLPGVDATERDEPDRNNSDTVTVPSVLTVTKSLLSTSHIDPEGLAANTVSIGETAVFSIGVTTQQGRTAGVVVRDDVPAGISFVAGTAIFRSAAGVTAVGQTSGTTYSDGSAIAAADISLIGGTGGEIRFNFSQVNVPATGAMGTGAFQVEYTTLVENVATSQGGSSLVNSVSATATGPNLTSAVVTQTLNVVEPVIGLVKNLITAGTDAGDAVVYDLVITNTGTATGYDINVLDALDSSLNLTGAAVSGAVPGYITLTNNGSTLTSLNYLVNQLQPGDSVTVRLSAVVVANAPAGDTIGNVGSLTYTSLPGVNANERGGIGGGVNDYTATSTAPNFTLASPTFDKLTPADTTYNIGETVTYDLLVTLPEGVTQAVSISDVLPAGLTFVSGVVQTAAGGVLANTFAGAVPAPTANGANTLFTFGSITTTNDNDTTNNSFLFRVTALVGNVIGNQSGTTFTNSATFNYTHGTTGPQSLVDAAGPVTVVEPRMTLDKTVGAPSIDLEAGDTVTYTLTFNNLAANGATSTAFDALILDSMPAGVLITSIDSVSAPGSTVDSAVTITGGGTGLTGQFDIPIDGTVTITYTATLQTSINPNTSYVNNATLTFTSTNGVNPDERTGVSPNLQGDGSLNDYRLIDSTTITTSAPTFNIQKTSPTTSAQVGDTVPYTLTLTILEGTTNNVVIADVLPAGLQFTAGTAVITPAAGMSVTNGTEGTALTVAGQNLTFNLGTVTNPASGGNTITITFDTLVLDTAANAAVTAVGQTKTNSVTATGTGVPPSNDTFDVPFVEPNLVVTKGVDDPTPDINQVVTFTVNVAHSATSSGTAYDIRVRDLLPAGLTLDGASLTITSAPGTTTINGGSNLTAGNQLDFTLSQLAVGESVTFTYQARVVNSLATVGTTQENNVRIYYDTQAGDEANNAILNNAADGTPDRDYGAVFGTTEAFNATTDPAQDTERLVVNTNSIAGTVYRDNDGNGVFNAGDTRLNTDVRLQGTTSSGLPVDITLTTVNGDYNFTGLPAGIYMLTEVQPAGHTDGLETIGTAFGGPAVISDAVGSNTITGITVPTQGSTAATGYNFGETLASSLAGQVYRDFSNNGLVNVGELGINNVTVTLTGTDIYGQAVNETFVTAGDGNYLFNSIGGLVEGLRPGNYTITETNDTDLAPYFDGIDTVGSAGGTVAGVDPQRDVLTVTLLQNTAGSAYNFGELDPASISGFVYSDGDNDGVFDVGTEAGINNVQVRLTGTDDRGNAVNILQVTPISGAYSFTGLRPGNYTVTEVNQPGGFADGIDSIGTGLVGGGNGTGSTAVNDVISNINIINVAPANNTGINYNFGEIFNSEVTKTIVNTSESFTGPVAGTERVAIGEIVRYRFVVEVGESTFTDFTLRDTLPAGMRFINDGSATLALVSNGGGFVANTFGFGGSEINGAASNVTPFFQLNGSNVSSDIGNTADNFTSGGNVYFHLGDITNTDTDADREFVVIEFNAQVLNETGNQSGATLTNSFNVLYDLNASGSAEDTESVITSSTANAVVAESNIAISKALLSATPPIDAGDTVTYRITLTNNAAGNNATTAHNVRVLDLLDAITAANVGVDFELIDTTLGSGISVNATSGATVATNASSVSNLDLTLDRLNVGETVTIDIVTRVVSAAPAGATLTNSVTAFATSLPGTGTGLLVNTNNGPVTSTPGAAGTVDGERTGENVAAPTDNTAPANNAVLNNYAVGATIPLGDVLSLNTPLIDKTFGTTSEGGTAGTNVAIGETVTFNITVTLPEGTTQGVIVTDNMQPGLEFLSASVDFTGSGVTSFALPTPAVTGNSGVGTQLVYTLGNLINAADNNAGNNTFTITVTARVSDLPGNVDGIVRSNAANLQFTDPDGPGTGVPTVVAVTDPNGDPSVTIVEPQLQIVKAVDDTTPDIDQVVTYTLTINHQGISTSDAYDVRIRDLIPHGVGTGLILNAASILVNGVAVGTSPLVASNSTTGDQLDLTLSQIGLAETITITYQARVENTLTNVGTLLTPNNYDNNARIYWDSVAGDEATNAVFDEAADSTPDRDYGATPGLVEAHDGATDLAQDGVRVTVNTNSITGVVYRDANVNGTFQDGVDERLNNVTVRLTGTTASGLAVDITTQTVNGDYAFTGLPAGTYVITETQPVGLTDAVESVGTIFGGAVSNVLNADTITGITIPAQSNTTGVSYNFGEVTPGSIAGSVYHDLDNDGFRDALEIGLVSEIRLTGTDVYGQPVDITLPVTDGVGDGRFLFNNLGEGLRPGTYTLTQTVQPAGYLDGKETAGTSLGTADSLTSVISAIPLAQGANATDYLFGEVLPSSLAGTVYVDASNDGVLDAGETRIGGVLITLTGTDDRGNAVNATFTTLVDGTYSFAGLRPGNYTLTETQPAAYNDGLDKEGTLGGTVANDVISNITTTSGDAGTGYNFGERSTTITGTVYRDRDRAGDLDAGVDTGLGGVLLTLRDNLGNVVATTTTLPDGTYQFTDVAAGDYTITETQPLGYGSSTPNVLTVAVPIGGLTDQNFGETLSTLAGLVFQDIGNDGVFNGADAGIGGVTVRITGTDAAGNTINRTTTTNFDGTYSFDDLLSGTYAVRETQPTSFNDGIDTAGSLAGTVTNDFVSNIVMPVATDATGYNFAEIVPTPPPGKGAIRGTVFRDGDRDGTLNAGDSGIGTVTLELLDVNGNVVGTTTTGSDGRYAFVNLTPGTYSVRETQPLGYGSSTPNTIATIAVAADQTVIDQNFGETTSGLAGTVFTDLDKDGVLTPGEPGISGVTLTLTGTDVNGAAVTATTITDSNGNYSFDGLLAGTYRIVETQPANRADGLDKVGTSGGTAENDVLRNIALAADTQATGYNFGELLPSISGTVFRDDNVSGGINGTEPGIGNVTLTLRDNLGNVVATTTTNPDGTYEFVNVMPGNYTITETQPDGYGSSTANVINVPVSTANITNQNFGETTGSLAGTVYRDNDNSNTLNAGDVGLGGVIVRLTGTDAQGNVIDTTITTNTDGTYVFSGLLGGTYRIEETQPSGFTDGAETVGTSGGDGNTNDVFADIGLGNGIAATGYNFGETITPPPGQGAVTGTVWLDRDRDGVLESGENGVNNVTLDLVDGGGNVVDTVTTGPDGRYVFNNVAPGVYSVVETQPNGYGSSTANTIGTVTVIPNAVAENNNFGETLGSLAGTVYRDANNNGTQLGAGETGIAGVTLTLTGTDINGNAVNRTTTTDANGDYVFTDLVASNGAGYTVTETQPAAFNDGLDAIGSAGTTLGNDVLSGAQITVTGNNVTDAVEYNFGELGTTLSGNVWVDRDRDGVREPGTEPNGILGVLITLLDSNGDIVATTTTNAAGDYSFSNLAAGDYTIVQTQPNGYGSSTLNVINATVPLAGLTDQNFGETVSTVAGQVFRDDAQDSILNGPDRGIEGVQIRLTGTDANGAMVNLVTTTDAAGNYQFIDLLAGNYTVTESQPADYRDFTDLVGSVGGLNTVNDRISSIGLGAAVDATDYDFAEIFRYDPTKTIVSTNNPGTSGNNLSVGETVRFRLVLALPDGTLNDVMLEEFLPNGLTFLNDGTAAVAFFSGSGNGLTSTTLIGAGLGTTDFNARPTFLLSDAQISSLPIGNEDVYRSGTDVYFKLGNITNTETAVGDTEREFVIVEFNARVGNEAANQNGRAMDNTFAPRFDLDNDLTADDLPNNIVSPPQRTVVAEPILALDKQITAGPKAPKPGDVITFTVTVGHAAGSSATAWESVFSDTLPNGMTLVNITTKGNGGAVVTNAAKANGQNITGQFDIPVGGSVTITYQVRIGAGVKAGTTLTNGADITWTSMPGDAPVERKSGDSLLDKGGVNDYELVAKQSVKVSAPPVPPSTGVPFFWDGFNNLGYPGSERNDSPFPYIPSDNDMYRLPILPLQPIYSGEADPGSTLVLTMFNTKGETIGTQTVVVDSGGNWLATFPSTTIRDYPNTIQISQLSAYYSIGSGVGHNLRTYFSPALNAGHFFFQSLFTGEYGDEAPLLEDRIFANPINDGAVKYHGEVLSSQGAARGY